MYLGEDRPVPTVHSELMDPVRILLVDDHLMVTEALASRLSAAMDLWVAGRCTTADPNLLEIVRGLRPDVITIEVEPLGPAVGEVLRGLMAARPEARVVVLSADHNIAHGGGGRPGRGLRLGGQRAGRRRAGDRDSRRVPGLFLVPAGHARRDPQRAARRRGPGPGARGRAGHAQPRERDVLLSHDGRQARPPDRPGPADLHRHRADAYPEHLRQAGRAQPPGGGAGGPGRRPAGARDRMGDG